MEVLILYWLFSSLFICGTFYEDDWKVHPIMCFCMSFVLGGLCSQFFWVIFILNSVIWKIDTT